MNKSIIDINSLQPNKTKVLYKYLGKNRVGTVQSIMKNSTIPGETTYTLKIDNTPIGLESVTEVIKDEAIEAVKKLNQKTDNKMAKGGGIEKGIDLFEDYDNIPNNVQSILDKYSSAFEDGEYKGLENALKELNKIGYTFDYDLEGQAYDLRKKSQKGKSSYANGGGVGEYKVYDEIIIMDDDTKDAILDDEELQKFIKPTDFLRNKNSQTFIWIDRMEYDEFDKLANFLGYKYAKGGGVGKTFTYEVKQNKWTLFPNNRYYRRFFIPKSDSNSYREITEHGVTEEIVEQNDIYDITISVTKQGKEYFEKTYKGKYAKGGGVGTKGKTNKEISDMYWQEAEDIDKEINSDRGGETSGPNWERIEKLEKERDRYRKLAIKYDSKMRTGGGVEFYGVDSETEKRAGLSRGSFSTFKNGDAFKDQLKKYFLKENINNLSEGKVIIEPGNSNRLTFKSNKGFNEKNVRNIFKPIIDRFEKVYSHKLQLNDFKDKSFVLEFNNRMAKGGGVGKKIVVNTYKGKVKYTNQEIQEMIDDIDMYWSADNLPSWLYETGSVGHPDFPKNKKQVIDVLKEIKNSKNDVYINVSSKEPYYTHIIKMADGGGLKKEDGWILDEMSAYDSFEDFYKGIVNYEKNAYEQYGEEVGQLKYTKNELKSIWDKNSQSNKMAQGGGINSQFEYTIGGL